MVIGYLTTELTRENVDIFKHCRGKGGSLMGLFHTWYWGFPLEILPTHGTGLCITLEGLPTSCQQTVLLWATLLDSPAQLLIIAYQSRDSNSVHSACRQGHKNLLKFTESKGMERKGEGSNFEPIISIPGTTHLLRFLCTTTFTIYRKGSKKEKISPELQFFSCKCPRRIARVFPRDRKAAKSINETLSKHTTHSVLKQLEYSNTRSHQMPLLSA